MIEKTVKCQQHNSNLVTFCMTLFFGWLGLHRINLGFKKSGYAIMTMSLSSIFMYSFGLFQALLGKSMIISPIVIASLTTISSILFLVVMIWLYVDCYKILTNKLK